MSNPDECAHCANARRGGGGRSVSGSAEWHLFKRRDEKFAWHLIGDNGSDIVATDGGQGYSSSSTAAAMMKKVRSGYTTAPMQPSAK